MTAPLAAPLSTVSQRRVLADYAPRGWAWDAAVITGGAALVGLLAQASYYIPGFLVPFTGQTLGVLLVAGALGSRRGSLSMALYGALGCAGVPWLAGGAAGVPHYTLGYLIGFVAAANVVGLLADRGWTRNAFGTIAAMVIGMVLVYAFGMAWLGNALGGKWQLAFQTGVLPFLPMDAVKVLIAAALLPGTWGALTRQR